MDEGGAASTALGAGVIVGGRYRVESQLGRGAAGVVYRVVDERSGERLALKRLRVPGNVDRGLLLSQFEREYHTLCQLAHPRIIEVYEYGVDADDAFYTMELLDGQDLRARGRLPWREACALLRDVASSLAILHSRRLLHRDVSARNVRCTSDGRAKLIDFGAMAPMGGVKNVVGTPPFVPPEALQLQALDARSDLYALGALAYWMLAGRHAYPARTFDQLPDLWRSAPAPVAQFAPELPKALDRLVAQLLQLDRSARPATAAEVMERLSGIAGLPLEERAEVSRAYLAMPALVGRDRLLQQVRGELVSAMQGQGACVLIEGAAGTGRSRFLDACVLEAKLLGAVVLRADSADAAAGEYGVLKALCAELSRTLPEVAARVAGPRGDLLAQFIAPRSAQVADRPAPERRLLQATLRDFLVSVARGRRVLIAVDDVETADEPSAAVLALLAHAQRRNLSLLFATESSAQTVALAVLRETARTVVLEPLTSGETEALLRSVFGDGDHLAPLARGVHDLSLGNPRWVMALAERLVERGVARYESGGFRLPAALAPGDLPDSLSSALAARVAALSPDAHELARALALTDPAVLSLERYPRLTAHADRARTYRAIDALVSASVLVPSGVRYRFAQRELVPLLQAGSDAAQQQALHARIADAVQGCDDAALLPHHLLLAGQERAAIERLLPLRCDPEMGYSTLALELLDRAIPAAERLGLPMQVRVELLMWMIDNASMLGEYTRFLRHALPLLEVLERASGLRDYHELDAAMPAAERLTLALTRAQQRHEATPEALRGLPPSEAIPHLARLCAMFNTMTSIAQDLTLIERLPSLEPLCALSPALWVVQQMVEATRLFQQGRYEDSGDKALAVLERVSQPDRATLDPSYQKAVRLGVLYSQGAIAAARGQAAVPAWIAELEQDPGHRVNAVRLRMAYELMQGDLGAARDCRRKAELLQLQDPGRLLFPGSTNRLELLAYAYAEDVLGVKRVMEQIEIDALRYPCLQVTLGIARSVYLRLQGDLLGACAVIEQVLAAIAPGRHLDWGFAAAVHVNALLALGRFAAAVERGGEYLAIAQRERLSPTHRSLMKTLADALLGAGRHEQAAELIAACIAELEAVGSRGLVLGMACETRARIAIAMADEAAFRSFSERTAHEYRRGHAAALRARHESLMREAQSAGLAPKAAPHQGSAEWTERGLDAGRAAFERLVAAADSGTRAREALRLLLEATAAERGYLFGLHGGELVLLASSDAGPAQTELRAMLDGYLRGQLACEGAATAIDSVVSHAPQFERFTDAGARVYTPLLLLGRRDGEACVAAIAALHHAGDLRPAPRRALLEAIAAALLASDDVDPVTCVA